MTNETKTLRGKIYRQAKRIKELEKQISWYERLAVQDSLSKLEKGTK